MTSSGCVIMWMEGNLSYEPLKSLVGLVQLRALSWGLLSLFRSKDYWLIPDASEILVLTHPRGPCFLQDVQEPCSQKLLDILTTKMPLLKYGLLSAVTFLYCRERGKHVHAMPRDARAEIGHCSSQILFISNGERIKVTQLDEEWEENFSQLSLWLWKKSWILLRMLHLVSKSTGQIIKKEIG